MLPEISEFLITAWSVVCCSVAVKLTDDYLDQDIDTAVHSINWAQRLGPGTMVYAMLFLALSASLNASVSLSLFFSCYVVGMFNDMSRVFPSKLTGYQESLLLFVLGVMIFGWQVMTFSFLFILSVQLIDDILDIHLDRLSGQRNLAHRFGTVECLLAAIIALLLSWYLLSDLFPSVFSGASAFYIIVLFIERGWSQCWTS